MRQHIKTTVVHGKLAPVSQFKTWFGENYQAVKVGSSSYYHNRRNIKRVAV
jgi:hypothetical protein